MKDFKSYSEENPQGNRAQNTGANTSANSSSNGGAYNNTVEMAKGQILHTIISEAERGKREGTLTNADLDNFYTALSPLLDGFKKRKLKEVIMRLKSI